MVHEEYKEMLSAHALSALDRDAEDALNEHLSQCASCRDELDHQWRNAAAALALAADPAEPSPQVRDRILRQIQTEVRGVDLRTREPSKVRSDAVGGSQVLPFQPPARNIWRSIGSLGAIAATVVFVGLLVSLVVLWQQNRAAKAEIAKLSSELKKTEDEAARQHDAINLFTSPGAKMAELAGTNMAPGAFAKLAYDRTGHAMLMAQGLPAAPSGKSYQLWYIVGNKPMPGRVFTPDNDGKGLLQDQVPAVAMNSAVFAITLEPAGGMPTPTGKIYLQSGS